MPSVMDIDEDECVPQNDEERVNMIIAKASIALNIPMEPIHPTITKAQRLKGIMRSKENQHEQVRKNILAQLPPPAPSNPSSTTPSYPSTRVDELTDVVLSNLEAPWDGKRILFAGEKRPNDVYSTPLRTTQGKPIPARTKEIILTMKALEVYNEFARQESRNLQEQYHKLEESSEGSTPAKLAREAFGPSQSRRQSMAGSTLDASRISITDTSEDTTMGGTGPWVVQESGTVLNLAMDPRLRR